MRNKLLTLAAVLVLLAVLGDLYAKPLLAQIRAALVQNVDEPGRNPIGLSVNADSSETFWSVPGGKRYVIEQYTAFCEVSNTGFLTSVELSVSTGGALVSATTPAFVSYTISDGNVVWGASSTTRLYADPNTTLTFAGVGSSIKNCSVSVSGYAISQP
jgi:hypothetical protein